MDGNIAGLILLGTQINLDTNTQSEFFTGVSVADLAWLQNLGSLSGLTGAVHGLIIIALITILGNLVKQNSNSLLFISIIQPFVLYYLVLAQTALFAFF